jgi:hypothetical protein
MKISHPIMDKMKKRGRKPKGGKIIDTATVSFDEPIEFHNVILHLRCNLSDIGNIDFNKHVVDPYDNIAQLTELHSYVDDTVPQKIKNMAHRLHTNDINKRSDCFWCTYSYDTSVIYIPKNKTSEQYQVYGSFCCPECAAAYLFMEKIDQSTRSERYQLLNQLYSENAKPIVPAPSPHYLLNKFYGTLTIQEYREIIQDPSRHLLLANKPICCTYPELIQSTVDTSKGEYKLCRKSKI